jgi:hypothetical protein
MNRISIIEEKMENHFNYKKLNFNPKIEQHMAWKFQVDGIENAHKIQ